jgi:hypothetical protein
VETSGSAARQLGAERAAFARLAGDDVEADEVAPNARRAKRPAPRTIDAATAERDRQTREGVRQ